MFAAMPPGQPGYYSLEEYPDLVFAVYATPDSLSGLILYIDEVEQHVPWLIFSSDPAKKAITMDQFAYQTAPDAPPDTTKRFFSAVALIVNAYLVEQESTLPPREVAFLKQLETVVRELAA